MPEFPNIDGCVFVPLHSDDCEELSGLEEVCFPEDYWSASAFRQELENPEARYILAKVEGKIIGYGGVWLMSHEAHIVNLAVAPDWRGRGLGFELVRQMLALATARGLRTASLIVRVSNETAIRLYRRLGFEAVTVLESYYVYEDGQLMRCMLPGPVE